MSHLVGKWAGFLNEELRQLLEGFWPLEILLLKVNRLNTRLNGFYVQDVHLSLLTTRWYAEWSES